MQKTVATLTLLLSATLAYAGHDFTERTEKSFPLAANGRLVVRSEIGDIRIHASDRRDVRIVAVKRARDTSDDEGARRAARMHLNFSVSASEVRVTVEWPSRSISNLLRNESNLQVDFEIEAPRDVRIEAQQNIGDIDIDGAASEVSVQENIGDVRVGYVPNFKPRMVHLETGIGEVHTSFSGRTTGFLGKKFTTIQDGEHSLSVRLRIGDVTVHTEGASDKRKSRRPTEV